MKFYKILDKFLAKFINYLWSNHYYILKNLPKSDITFYKSNIRYRELEHQVGRFLNIKKIVEKIENEGIKGDVVEFGVWEGLGLSLFDLCFKNKFRNLIGIDNFSGLPKTSTIWKKGSFSDTSENIVLDNYYNSSSLKKMNLRLIRGQFEDPKVAEDLYKTTKDLSIIHFDLDLGFSLNNALKIIEPYLKNRKDPIFFLFDDWGCHPDEIPDVFLNWLKDIEVSHNLKATKISSTRFTRYYQITFF